MIDVVWNIVLVVYIALIGKKNMEKEWRLINKVVLSGNLCKDIELKTTSSGKASLNNTIAVKRDFKNADGEYESDFVNAVFWGNQAEYVDKYLSKGSKIGVVGRLQTRTYENNNGDKVFVTEVVVESVEGFSTPKKENTTSDFSPFD